MLIGAAECLRCDAASREDRKLFLPQADALDLPFQLDAGIILHARAHGLAEILDIRRGGTAKIDQEVTVQLRTLSIAEPQPAATRCVDELPSLLSRGILERRTARTALDGLGRLARLRDLVPLRGNSPSIAASSLEQRFGEDDVLGDAAMPIAVVH